LHLHISDLRGRSVQLETALDALSTGVLLLGAKGEILLMNWAASAVTGRADGLLATSSGLRAERPNESARLEKLIQEAIDTSAGKGLNAGGGVLISRKEHAPLQLLVTPVGNMPAELTRLTRAMVFVNDPEQRVRPTQDILRTMFGLTPAESRVALLLGDGKSLREIAQMLGVSPNTLKSHLAIIYTKTNTLRQSQLVRLLMRLPVEPSA
jgi:DNA-binding CsgD family transcriptional regulator